jgi:hypothetical protein
MINRGTVVVFTDADPHELRITKQRAKKLYKILIEVRNGFLALLAAGVCVPTVAPRVAIMAPRSSQRHTVFPPYYSSHLITLPKQNSSRETGITG